MVKRNDSNPHHWAKKLSLLGALLGAIVGVLVYYFLDVPPADWSDIFYLGLFAGVCSGLFVGGIVGALNDMRLRTT